MKNSKSRIKKAVFCILALPLFLVLLAFGLLQTQAVKDALIQAVNEMDLGELDLEMANLEGFIPFHIRLERLVCSDRQGPFVHLDHFELKISPWELVQGTLRINLLAMHELSLHRLPEGPERDTAAEDHEAGPQGTGLPLSFMVDTIDIPSLKLGSDIAGREMHLALSGQGIWEDMHRWKVLCDLTQTDTPGLDLHLDAGMQGPAPELKLNLNFRDHPDGPALSRTGMVFPAPLGLKLSGAGPLDKWEGQLDVDLGHKPLVTTGMTLQYSSGQLKASADSQITPARILPQAIKPLQNQLQNIDLHLRATLGTDLEHIELHDFRLQSDLATVVFQAQTDLKAQTLVGSGSVQVPELVSLQPLFGQDLSGAAQLDITANGPWNQPDLVLTSQGRGLALGNLHIQQADFILRPKLTRSESGAPEYLLVRGELEASPLYQDSDLLLPGPLQGTFRTALDVVRRQIDLKTFQFNLPGVVTSLQGQAEANGPFHFQIAGQIDDVHALPQLSHFTLHSGVDLNSSVRGNWRQGQMKNDLQIILSQLRGLPQPASEILGSQVSIQASSQLSPQKILSLNSLRIQGKHTEIRAQAGMDLNSNNLHAQWNVQGPNLAVLKRSDLSGQIAADGDLKGTVQDFKVALDLEVKEFTAPELKPCTLRTGFQGRIQPQKTEVDGAFNLGLKKDTRTIQVLTGVTFNRELLVLPDLELRAPMTELTATIKYQVQKGIVDSDLMLEIEDTQWMQTFTPHEVLGGLSLAADISGPLSNLRLSVQGKSNDLQAAEFKVNQLDFLAEIDDMQTIQGRVEAEATNIHWGQNRIRRLQLQARGDQGRAQAHLDLAGHIGHDVKLQTEAQIRRQHDLIQVILPQGQGNFADLPFSWTQPFQAEMSQNDVAISWPSLNLGRGTLQIKGSTENKAVQGSLQIKGMDLAQWPLPTQWALNGRTDMKAQLSGTRAAPDLQFNVQVRDLTSQAGQTQDLPPIHIQGAGRLGSEQMQAQSSVQAGPGLDLQARLQLPLDFSLHPFQFQIGNTVSGQTQGRADLGQIFASLPVDGQDVSGHLSWDMSCSGPLPLPQLHGRAQLTKGEFELFQTGTLLRKIEGVIELHGDRAEIVRFQATDGEQGSVQASGDIAFGLDQEPTYTLQASLDQSTLIRMEVATGAISGDIKLKGNGNEASVQGNLKAFPINVGIPDPSPSGLEGLNIISVQDTPATPDAKDSQKQSPSLAQNTTLDIHVQIPGGLFVRGRGLDSEWTGDLHIQGTANRPLIAGHVAIKRGHLNLLTKRFTLDQGRVTFLSKHPPEPELDLTASTSAKDLLAKVHITGKATEPSLQLSSDPALPRDEILARILFNRQLSQITPLQAVKLALAVRTLTSGGNGGVMGSLRQHMGLDELSIDTDPQSSAGPGVTVGAGKYLNEDVYFKVEKGLEENDGRVVVNIRLTPRISIETQAGSEHQGMFISWSYSY